MHRLLPHPDMPAGSVERVRVKLAPSGHRPTVLEYRVFASGVLALPAPEQAARRDGLWQATCFEMFVHAAGEEGYQEFNFSPSHCWAAYDFASYRKGGRDLALAPPKITGWADATGYSMRVELDLVAPWASACRIGLSAVIEEADGAKSYWALAHPPGKPDFHHPDCFAIELPALV